MKSGIDGSPSLPGFRCEIWQREFHRGVSAYLEAKLRAQNEGREALLMLAEPDAVYAVVPLTSGYLLRLAAELLASEHDAKVDTFGRQEVIRNVQE